MPNMKSPIKPGLFGQDHNNSSRDYTNPDYWGKNQFNSSFPASLVAYMSSKGLKPVYLTADGKGGIKHASISGLELFLIDPLAGNAYYNFEAGFPTYEKYYTGEREKIDLVMVNSDNGQPLIGLEVKLTALPDRTTKDKTEDKYGCEIVVRSPTICFLACSICKNYDGEAGRNRLKSMIDKVPKINHWEDTESVLPHYDEILKAVADVCDDMQDKQTPLIIQPVWKTVGGRGVLADDCLDVFVWSNIATVQMFNKQRSRNRIDRHMRTVVWLYRMLFEYVTFGQFDYVTIVKNYAYGSNSDKAFAISGNISFPMLACDELTHPRINKNEIKNIILGGGQNLLSPERRFDAVLVNSPELFV